MLLETYQQRAAENKAAPKDCSFATVGQVYADGIALIFDGESTASAKHYLCNTAVKFAAGQRVHLVKDSGTYIVEYPVGVPG